MTWLRLKAAAVALTLGAVALAPGCAGGVYADSSGKTCIIVFVFPICN